MRTQGNNKEGQKRQSQGVMDLGHTRKIGKDKEEQRNRRQRVSQRVRDKTRSILQYRQVKQECEFEISERKILIVTASLMHMDPRN